MLSRLTSLAAKRSLFALSAAGLTTAGASFVLSRDEHWMTSTTGLESASLIGTPPSTETQLPVPTFEASMRALRLVQTVSLMVLDYKAQSFRNRYLPKSSVDEARMRFEEERNRCQQDLQAAQIAYTTEDKGEIPEGMTRKDIILLQRDAVHRAAENMATAEERLQTHLQEEEKAKGRNSNVHYQAADRLLSLCQINGGAYIKIGQHLANLDYLIPVEYINTLSTLFNAAPRSDYKLVSQVIQEELGKPPEEIFDSFAKEPLASASLAQVHVAFDKETGQKLAIKVQHSGLRETSEGDVAAITFVVRLLERWFPEDFNFGWIADELAPQLAKELDFHMEGRNAERAAIEINHVGLSDRVIIPKVLWKHTTSRVLTMKFEEGFPASDVQAIDDSGLKRRDVAKLVSSVFNAQVFLSSFVHCDPHPANVLIRRSKDGHRPEMVLVDHGLYKQIDNKFRLDYARLWQSLMLADLKGIKASCQALGVDEMYTLLAAMLTSRPYDEIMERAKTGQLVSSNASVVGKSSADKAMIQGYAQQFLQDIMEILGTLPRQMLLLLKMNDCLRHIDFSLGSPTNTLVVAGRYASLALYKDQMTNGGVWDRWHAWLDYTRILFRIYAHEYAIWWTNLSGPPRFLTNRWTFCSCNFTTIGI